MQSYCSVSNTHAQNRTCHLSSVRDIIASFLNRCNLPYAVVEPDPEFQAACWAEASQRGYALDKIGPYMFVGFAMSGLSYTHMPDKATKIFIALYTAHLTYLDDRCDDHVDGLSMFSQNFARNQPQNHKILNDLVDIFCEISNYWTPIVADLILTSSLEFVTSMVLEHEMENMEVHTSAKDYPNFTRNMSGISQAYSLFMFPKDLPIGSYIQCLPQIKDFTNHLNDILSFYKEELADENLNYVSLMAQIHGTSKIKALQQVVDKTVDAHERILAVLKPRKVAYDAFRSYSYGYVQFHAVCKRYRLGELAL